MRTTYGMSEEISVIFHPEICLRICSFDENVLCWEEQTTQVRN